MYTSSHDPYLNGVPCDGIHQVVSSPQIFTPLTGAVSAREAVKMTPMQVSFDSEITIVNSPYDPEVVAVEMPGLDRLLVVLEDDFNEVMQIGAEHRRAHRCRNAVPVEDSADVEVVC